MSEVKGQRKRERQLETELGHTLKVELTELEYGLRVGMKGGQAIMGDSKST